MTFHLDKKSFAQAKATFPCCQKDSSPGSTKRPRLLCVPMRAALFLLLSAFIHTNSFLLPSCQKSQGSIKSRLLVTPTVGKNGGSSNNKPSKKIKKQKKEKRTRFGTPRSKHLSFDSERANQPRDIEGGKVSAPSRFLVDYDANRNPEINKFRLLGELQCPHSPDCPSCVISKQVGDIPIIQSAKRYFSSTGIRRRRRDVLENDLEYTIESSDDGFLEVVIPSELGGWRTQAKLAVESPTSRWGRDENGCNFGLYERGTHNVVPIPNCGAHHPAINKAVAALKAATLKVRTVAYSEEFRDGAIRYAQFRVERSTGKVSLTLVWNSSTLKGTQPYLSRLVKELTKESYDNHVWHSIWCHCNEGTGNAIFNRNPNRWHRLMGPEYMREPLSAGEDDENGGWLYFTPQTFRQGNMEGFDILAKDVARAIPGGSKVCELYAGVGVLGLTALQYHHDVDARIDSGSLEWIRCSDENPTNLKCFTQAVKSLDLTVTRSSGKNRASSASSSKAESGEITIAELTRLVESGEAPVRSTRRKSSKPKDKTSYIVASAAQALKSGQALGANVLVVDPPRKGLDDEVLDALCKPFNAKQPYVESRDFLPMADSKILWTNDVELLIYVSCGFDALARDCERLLSSGNWILESATGYILFPGSNHVETLCTFTRSS